jgi:hypothetical protein
MSTSTLVLNFVGWTILSIVVTAVSVLVPLRLDRASCKNTQAQPRAMPLGEASVRTPVFAARSSADLRGRSPSGSVRGARPQTAPH